MFSIIELNIRLLKMLEFHRVLEEDIMKKDFEEMKDEYDFSKGVRGKYAKKYHEASNVIVLDSDVFQRFPNSEAVNQALRTLAKIQDQKQA